MNETALNVLKTINSHGFQAYLVGGYPRDLYLGKETTDYDICTNATPKELKKIFGKKISPTDQYGSVVLIDNNIRFEITTFRKDIKYENNRKPIEIEYVDTLLEDLKRRDFIINTMCIDSNGHIIDLLQAKEDINNKIIKTVGDPYIRIEEDSLRILRAIRFATILDFKLDESLKDAIKANKNILKTLSFTRKKEELDKIFSSSNRKYGIELIKELELENELDLKNLNTLIPTTYVIGTWAQLDVLDKYQFNSVERDSIVAINELMHKDVLDNFNIYKYGLYISTIVGEIKNIDKTLINEAYNNLQIHNKTEILISPEEICKILNKKPSKILKEILTDIEYKIVSNKLNNAYEDLEKYVIETYS